MEKIQNIIENNMGSSRRFENVKEELLDYQFQYVEKIEKGEINEIKEKEKDQSEYERNRKKFEDSLKTDFEKKLFKYTYLDSNLFEEYHKRIENKDNDDSFFQDWLRSIFDKINEDYSSGNRKWKEDTLNIIKESLIKLGAIKESKEENKKNIKVGLISFNLEQVKKLQDFGIKSNNLCANLHFESLYKQKENNNEISNIFSVGESFSKLAVKIIEDYPQVKFIIGRSWLIDSPIGRKIGFNVYKKHEKVVSGSSFWGQFINEKGEINKEKMNKFLNTGIPEFYLAEGDIKIEDFLKKYLPKERKGVIKLKELSDKSKEFLIEKEKILKKIEQDLSFEDTKSLLENSVLGDFFKMSEGQELMGFIKKMKDQKLKSMDDLQDKRVKQLKEMFKYYFEERENQYIEREVLID